MMFDVKHVKSPTLPRYTWVVGFISLEQTCDDPIFFNFFYTNVKRVITVVCLRVAQPTYGTCPITWT